MRRWLLGCLLCLIAWATFAQIAPSSADTTIASVTSVSAVPSETEAAAPQDAGHSGRQWHADYRATVSPTASLWKSSVVHADLAATPTRDSFVATATVDLVARPAPDRSPHLLHTPLLI